MQALLHCPSVLVCVGREPFKPVSMENLRKHSVEKLPNLAPRSNGNNVNENNESKKNSGAYCTVLSRPVSHSMEITGTYCTAPTRRFHVENVLPSLCLPGLSILPFFFSGFLLGFPPYTLQSFFCMLPVSGWLPFLFHISVSPFPSRTPSFPVSASEAPQTLEISHESSIAVSLCHIMSAFACTRTRGCPGFVSRRFSCSCRLQLQCSLLGTKHVFKERLCSGRSMLWVIQDDIS